MVAPISDDQHRKYAPRWLREQPPERPYVELAPTAPSNDDRRTAPEFASRPEPVPESPPPRPPLTLSSRIAVMVTFAALVALLAIFATPLWQGARAPLNGDSQTLQVAKPSDQLTTNKTLADNPLVPATGTIGGQSASTQTQQAPPVLQTLQPWDRLTTNKTSGNIPLAPPVTTAASGVEPSANAQAQIAPPLPISRPLGQEPKSVNSPVRGVTDTEIRFGISAPFSGAAKELGQNMKLGIEAAFDVANDRGGVHGRKLRLIAADDGYEPTRTAETMKQLFEKDQVFGMVGNVGTPTAAVAVPYALQHKMLFFGAFTGAGLLRNDPPDRYVFNYRASYAEETAAVVQYLVKVKRLKPTQIAVFAQQDSYGDAGFAGVAKAIRALGGDENAVLRLYYQRNTVAVDAAVAQLQAHNTNKTRPAIKAVIMVPTYRAAARFIEKTRDLNPGMIYTSVSFVGSTALANELMLLGSKYANGVIVTQVVPAVDGFSSLVLEYKSALAKYFPGEAPDYVSLEGYVMARVLIAALQNNGPDLDTEKLVQNLENLHDYDIGLGTLVTFGRSEHQGVHKVWGSQLNANGHYQPIDLQ